MHAQELRKKNLPELKDILKKANKDYEKKVTEILQNKEKNVKKSGSLRRNIARIKTVLNEKLKEEKNE